MPKDARQGLIKQFILNMDDLISSRLLNGEPEVFSALNPAYFLQKKKLAPDDLRILPLDSNESLRAERSGTWDFLLAIYLYKQQRDNVGLSYQEKSSEDVLSQIDELKQKNNSGREKRLEQLSLSAFLTSGQYQKINSHLESLQLKKVEKRSNEAQATVILAEQFAKIYTAYNKYLTKAEPDIFSLLKQNADTRAAIMQALDTIAHPGNVRREPVNGSSEQLDNLLYPTEQVCRTRIGDSLNQLDELMEHPQPLPAQQTESPEIKQEQTESKHDGMQKPSLPSGVKPAPTVIPPMPKGKPPTLPAQQTESPEIKQEQTESKHDGMQKPSLPSGVKPSPTVIPLMQTAVEISDILHSQTNNSAQIWTTSQSKRKYGYNTYTLNIPSDDDVANRDVGKVLCKGTNGQHACVVSRFDENSYNGPKTEDLTARLESIFDASMLALDSSTGDKETIEELKTQALSLKQAALLKIETDANIDLSLKDSPNESSILAHASWPVKREGNLNDEQRQRYKVSVDGGMMKLWHTLAKGIRKGEDWYNEWYRLRQAVHNTYNHPKQHQQQLACIAQANVACAEYMQQLVILAKQKNISLTIKNINKAESVVNEGAPVIVNIYEMRHSDPQKSLLKVASCARPMGDRTVPSTNRRERGVAVNFYKSMFGIVSEVDGKEEFQQDINFYRHGSHPPIKLKKAERQQGAKEALAVILREMIKDQLAEHRDFFTVANKSEDDAITLRLSSLSLLTPKKQPFRWLSMKAEGYNDYDQVSMIKAAMDEYQCDYPNRKSIPLQGILDDLRLTPEALGFGEGQRLPEIFFDINYMNWPSNPIGSLRTIYQNDIHGLNTVGMQKYSLWAAEHIARLSQDINPGLQEIANSLQEIANKVCGIFSNKAETLSDKAGRLKTYLESTDLFMSLRDNEKLSDAQRGLIDFIQLAIETLLIYGNGPSRSVVEDFDFQARFIITSRMMGNLVDTYCKSGEDRTGMVDEAIELMYIKKHQDQKHRFPLRRQFSELVTGNNDDDRVLSEAAIQHNLQARQVAAYSKSQAICGMNVQGARALQRQPVMLSSMPTSPVAIKLAKMAKKPFTMKLAKKSYIKTFFERLKLWYRNDSVAIVPVVASELPENSLLAATEATGVQAKTSMIGDKPTSTKDLSPRTATEDLTAEVSRQGVNDEKYPGTEKNPFPRNRATSENSAGNALGAKSPARQLRSVTQTAFAEMAAAAEIELTSNLQAASSSVTLSNRGLSGTAHIELTSPEQAGKRSVVQAAKAFVKKIKLRHSDTGESAAGGKSVRSDTHHSVWSSTTQTPSSPTGQHQRQAEQTDSQQAPLNSVKGDGMRQPQGKRIDYEKALENACNKTNRLAFAIKQRLDYSDASIENTYAAVVTKNEMGTKVFVSGILAGLSKTKSKALKVSTAESNGLSAYQQEQQCLIDLVVLSLLNNQIMPNGQGVYVAHRADGSVDSPVLQLTIGKDFQDDETLRNTLAIMMEVCELLRENNNQLAKIHNSKFVPVELKVIDYRKEPAQTLCFPQDEPAIAKLAEVKRGLGFGGGIKSKMKAREDNIKEAFAKFDLPPLLNKTQAAAQAFVPTVL
jgi:hypothetical protein